MKFAVFATTLLAAVGIAATASTVNNSQQKRDDTDVILYYSGSVSPIGYNFGDCIPLQIDGAPIVHGIVSQTARCYFFTVSGCSNPAVPPMIIIPADVDIPNVADFAGIIAVSGSCEPLL